MIFGKFFLTTQSPTKNPKRFDSHLSLKKRLIRKEARLGGQLFGALNKGQTREFFCLDENTWVWHEVWTDEVTRQKRRCTLRYDIRPDRVYKKQDNDSFWRELDRRESENFEKAVQAYRHSVLTRLYPEKDWL